MIESYRVGVTVFLNDLAGKGLLTLGAEMSAAQKRVNLLQKDLDRLQKSTGAQGIQAQKAARAQAQATASMERAHRIQESVGIKTQRLDAIHFRQTQLANSFRNRTIDQAARIQSIEQRAVAIQLDSTRKLRDQQLLLRGLVDQGRVNRAKAATQDAELTQKLAHTWDRAGIVQNQLMQGRIRTGLRIKEVDQSILEKEQELSDARRAHRRVTPIKEELTGLQARQAALIASRDAMESRARLAGETLAGRGATFQEQKLNLMPALRAQERARLTEQRSIKAAIADKEVETAKKINALEEERRGLRERLKNDFKIDYEQRQLLAKQELQATKEIQAAKEAADKAVLNAQFKSFEAAKNRAVGNQLAIAQNAVSTAKKAEEERLSTLAERQRRGGQAAAGGGIIAGIGAAMLYGAHATVSAASELQKTQHAVWATNPAMVDAFNKEAIRASTTYAPWMTRNEALQAMLDMHKAFGRPEEAIRFLPLMSQTSLALSSVVPGMDAKQAQEQFFSMVKAIELMGAASPGKREDFPKFEKYVDLMTKVMMYSGGRITAADFMQIPKFIGPQLASLSPEFLFTKMPWYISAMKSSGAFGNMGTFGPSARIAALERWAQGTAGLPKETAAVLDKMGLLQPGSFVGGKVKQRFPLKGADIAAVDPQLYVEQVFLPAFEKAFGKIDWENLTTQKFMFQGKEFTFPQLLQRAAGGQYAGSMLVTIAQNQQLVAKEQRGLALEQSTSATAATGSQLYNVKTEILGAQLKAMSENLGPGALDEFGRLAGIAGDQLRKFNIVLAEHPARARYAMEAMVDFGILLTGIGTVGATVGILKWVGIMPLIGKGLQAIGEALTFGAFATEGVSLVTIATGLGAVAAAIGVLWVAIKYFTDEDFKNKINEKAAEAAGATVGWFKNAYEDVFGNRADFSEKKKAEWNRTARNNGVPLPFPELEDWSPKGPQLPRNVERPRKQQDLVIHNYVEVDHQTWARATTRAVGEILGGNLFDGSAPDYREIQTRSDGRTER